MLEDSQTRTWRNVAADALFVLIGSEPETEWAGENLARDQRGFILTGPDVLGDPGTRWHACRPPPPHETSFPGCSPLVTCAGDRQTVASAVGDGAITIPLVHRYLQGIVAAEAVSGS